MKIEALEVLVNEILPLHQSIIEPVSKKIRVPFQTNLKGLEIYPSSSKRIGFMGFFYESLNKGLFGGRLNDVRFGVDFYNGESGTIKPDIVDDEHDIHWESKSSFYDKECEIMRRQLEGYRFLQYSKPDISFLVSFYRHTLPEIKKKERTLEQVFDGLISGTAFSVILPLSVVLQIYETPVSGGIKMARNYQSRNVKWPDCLCIRPHTINRFLINPIENFKILGFNQERFEIERYLLPPNITINKRKVRPFPIVKIVDKEYGRWVEEFMLNYEKEMERTENKGTEGLEMFDELEEEVPF